MDDTTRSLVEELTKLVIYGAVSYLRIAGKSDEEIDQLFNEALEKFRTNKPEDLPNV